MNNLSDIHTVEGLVEFLSEFIETVPTRTEVNGLREDMLTKEVVGALISKLVYRTEFNEALSAKASKADLIQIGAAKAEQSDVLNGMFRKADRTALYALEAKVNRLFPYQIVDNITERNKIRESDRTKIVVVLNATDDPALSNESTGAMYGGSVTETKWVLLSEIKYNAEQISYNAILGKPQATAAEIDEVVTKVLSLATPLNALTNIHAAMHVHDSSLSQIESAVNFSHSHANLPEVADLAGYDLITVCRNGNLVNVKASALKAYLKLAEPGTEEEEGINPLPGLADRAEQAAANAAQGEQEVSDMTEAAGNLSGETGSTDVQG